MICLLLSVDFTFKTLLIDIHTVKSNILQYAGAIGAAQNVANTPEIGIKTDLCGEFSSIFV